MKSLALHIIFFLAIANGFCQSPKTVDDYIIDAETFYKTNLDSAVYYSNKAYTQALQLKDTILIGRAIVAKTTYLLSQNKFKEAQELLQFNLQNKAKLSPKTLGNTFLNLGVTYNMQEQYDEAISQYLKGIDVFLGTEAYKSLARTYLNIGVIYEDLDKMTDANYFYDESLRYSALSKNSTIEVAHEGVDDYKAPNFKERIDIGKNTLSKIENQESSRLASVVYHDLSKNYIDYSQYALAIKNALKSVEIKERIGYENQIDFSYFIIGKSNVRLGNYDEGIYYLKKSVEKAKKRNLNLLASEMLILAYKEKGDYKQALAASELYGKAKDSINRFNETQKIEEITARFNNEKQAKEIELLESDNELQASLLSRQKTILWSTILGVLLLLTIIWFAYRNYKNKQNLQLFQTTQKLLQMQLNPHFLFNALNGIKYLVKQNDTDTSANYINNFSGLMRNILEHSIEKFISLDDDSKTIKDFLALQQLVNSHKFTYEVVVDEQLDAENLALPPMFTQPFVENAIIHGMNTIDNGHIQVGYMAMNNGILVEIKDNGLGIGTEKTNANRLHKSMGTSITNQRIETFTKTEKYPISLEVSSSQDNDVKSQGTCVRLTFPLKYI